MLANRFKTLTGLHKPFTQALQGDPTPAIGLQKRLSFGMFVTLGQSNSPNRNLSCTTSLGYIIKPSTG